MERKNLLSEISNFMIKVKEDYKYNIITKDKYDLMYIELDSLTDNFFAADLLLLITKFYTIKTIYLIMK